MQRVDFGDDRLAPINRHQPQRHRTHQRGQGPSKQVSYQPEDDHRRRHGIDSRRQIDPPGLRAEGQQRKQLAQQQVQRVAGGVGDAQLRRDDLEFEGVGRADCAGQGQQVNRQQRGGHEQRPQPPPVPVVIAEQRPRRQDGREPNPGGE
jgi:hypothetical protein